MANHLSETTDPTRLEALLVDRINHCFTRLEPAVLVTVRRLAREIFRGIPAAELQGADFWLAALRAQSLVLAEILRRLAKHLVRDSDLYQAIEKATKLEIEGQLVSRMTLAALLAPLQREHPHCLPVLIMKHAFGYTYDEIRGETNLSVQQIRTLLAKALQFLQRGVVGA